MRGTADEPQLPVGLFGVGLAFVDKDGIFIVCADGSLYYEGTRPGPGWHRNGTTLRRLRTLDRGRLRGVVIHKQRWRHYETGGSTHSRPPDDLARIWSCSLIAALWLYAWCTAARGLLGLAPPYPDLDRAASRRTVQRWMARAAALAGQTAQALRRELIEQCEPRPWEDVLRKVSGIPPPSRRVPHAVSTLREALTTFVAFTGTQDHPLARLLAGARRRWSASGARFLL